jgi:hypothetical protein
MRGLGSGIVTGIIPNTRRSDIFLLLFFRFRFVFFVFVLTFLVVSSLFSVKDLLLSNPMLF